MTVSKPYDLGIARQAIDQIFDTIEESPNKMFLLKVSYMEIYNEQVFDLLADESLRNRYGTLTQFFFPFYEKSCEESITPQ